MLFETRHLFETPDQNSNWSQAEIREMSQEQPPAQRLAKALQEIASERQEQKSIGLNATRAQQSHNVTTKSSRDNPWTKAETAAEALKPHQACDSAVVENGCVASVPRVRQEDGSHDSTRRVLGGGHKEEQKMRC